MASVSPSGANELPNPIWTSMLIRLIIARSPSNKNRKQSIPVSLTGSPNCSPTSTLIASSFLSSMSHDWTLPRVPYESRTET